MAHAEQGPSRLAMATTWVVGLVLGAVVGVVTSDVILGVIAGASLIAIVIGALRLWTGDGARPRAKHP